MLQYFLDKQKQNLPHPEAITFSERELYTTYLAGMFRTMRFGTESSHGRGMAIQFNYLKDKGAINFNDEGKYYLVWDKIKPAVFDLVHDLLMIEATGNYLGAKQLLEEKAIIQPEVEAQLLKMDSIPTDIEPVFVTAKQLVPEVIESGAEFESCSRKNRFG